MHQSLGEKQGGQTHLPHMLDAPFPLFGRTLEVFRSAPNYFMNVNFVYILLSKV